MLLLGLLAFLLLILLVVVILLGVVVLLVVGGLLAVGVWRVVPGLVVVGEDFWRCCFVVRGDCVVSLAMTVLEASSALRVGFNFLALETAAVELEIAIFCCACCHSCCAMSGHKNVPHL